MTGGSVGNQPSGLENNARGAVVKDYLLSASRRLSTSTLPLSMFGSEGTRSDEHIPLTSQRETAFVDHVTPHSCFLSNNMDHSARLRTSSLTIDVSTHNRKDIDSGNSSLIDSSSADSYQDFGSGCRSPTTSSSKSEQSLTSVNHNEFQIDSNRQRHSSVSDSISDSSGKMSINTSDNAESSEESLAQDKNEENGTRSSSVYVQEDVYSDSESQPFLYLPGEHCLQASNDDIKNGNSFHQEEVSGLERYEEEQLNCSSGDIFNSTVINIDLNHVSYESLKKNENRRLKNKKASAHHKHTAREREPLLYDHECTSAGTSDVISLNGSLKFPLRRSASLGNMSEVLPDGVDTLHDPIVSSSPQPVVNSHTMAAYQTVTNHPQPNCTSESESLSLCDHQFVPYRPALLNSPQVSGSPPTHVLFNAPHSNSPPQQTQHHQGGSHSHLCSNYYHPCMSHLLFNPEYPQSHVSETTSTTPGKCESQPALPHNVQGGCFPDTSISATRSPVQNLESVLGHGTPVSVSVLKQALKPSRSDHEKPLEVLVPKMKAPAEEAKQTYFTETLTSNPVSCQVKNTIDNDHVKAGEVPQTESTKEIKTQSSDAHETMTSSPSNKETSPCENTLTNISDVYVDSQVHAPVGSHDSNQHIFVYGRIPKEHYFQYYVNNPGVIPSICVPIMSGDQSQIRIEDNLLRSLSGPFYNPRSHLASVNQEIQPDVKHCHNASGVGLPTHLDGVCLSEPIFSLNTQVVSGFLQGKSYKAFGSKTTTLPTPHYQLPSLKHSKPHEQYVYHPIDSHVINTHSTTADHTPDLKANLFGNGNKVPSNDSTHTPPEHLFQQYQEQPDKPHINSILLNESDLIQAQMDDSGYQAGMTLSVPKACFVSGFLESHEHLNESRADSIRNSVPSSIDSGHPVNRSGSLPCSNTSQLGLLKANLDLKRQCNYFIREIPDYKYLCFVATVLNPVLGLVALICNHYAQKDLRQQRRKRANNFYFATIVFSTVAIFLTLIGGALLIAHSVILQAEKHEPVTPLVDDSCEDRFFGYDDFLQKFFGIDFVLYCEITKNEKIMQALKRFWLEDVHNKAIHNKERAHNRSTESSLPAVVDGNNSTTTENGELQIGDPNIFGTVALNDTSSIRNKKPPEGNLHSHYDLNKPEVSTLVKQVSKNGTSNNSLTRSDEHPIVPPGLQGEYQRYLGGEKRSKLIDGHSSVLQDVLSNRGVPSSPSNDRASWTTTVSTVHAFPVNVTEESVDGTVEMGESYEKANSSLTN